MKKIERPISPFIRQREIGFLPTGNCVQKERKRKRKSNKWSCLRREILLLKSYTTSVEFKKKQGGDGGIIEIRQNEKGGELSSKGTELTHISVIQCNRKKYVPAQSVGLTLWGKKKKSTMEWVTQQTKACMNLSLTPPLMSQVSGFQGEGLWSFPGKIK